MIREQAIHSEEKIAFAYISIVLISVRALFCFVTRGGARQPWPAFEHARDAVP